MPQGVYYKPDTGTYQAQVSVNRKNVRGPPRTNLQEAIVDRQRLLIAKANNQAEQESLELKMEYQRRVSMEGAVGPLVGADGEVKKRGRPRGSMGVARRGMLGIEGGVGGVPGGHHFNHHFPVLTDPSGGNPAFSLFIASTAAAAAANPNNPLPMSLLAPNFMFMPETTSSMLPSTELLLGTLQANAEEAGSPSSKRVKKETTSDSNANANI